MSDSDSSQKAENTDARRVLGQGAISAENSAVTVVNNSLDASVANNAIDNSTKGLGLNLDFALNVLNKGFTAQSTQASNALKALDSTTSLVKNAYEDAKGRGQYTDLITMGAIAMAGLVAFNAVKKG